MSETSFFAFIPRENTTGISASDIQECPDADIAIAEWEVAVLKGLVEGRFANESQIRALDTDALAKILLATTHSAEKTVISDRDYLFVLGDVIDRGPDGMENA